MDAVAEIKARLPIEELVGQYCQLQKKGRNFVCVCPFHNDSHPSFTVSPDKGIGYCFACNSGGDIFSFYQLIEGVDFRQALKDLAEKAGVVLLDVPQESVVKKDEKERLRECLEAAQALYRTQLQKHETAQSYLQKRGIPTEQWKTFGLGVAPDSFSTTYEHLLKNGFSRSEILKAGLAIQKDLSDGRMYDRFRNRLMFPIHDHQGKIVGFGGRTLGEDDAKYINSSEGPLYRKSSILYGYHYAKDAIRDQKSVVMVEGYFDVLACHRAGVPNVVAVSGTALTEEHVQILKRSAEKVVLCLDQDRAGRDASRRAFMLCSPEQLHVHAVTLDQKDPDEAAAANPQKLAETLLAGGKPYFDVVCEQLQKGDVHAVEGKRLALETLAPLIQAIGTAVERDHYLAKAAGLMGTTEVSLKEDLDRLKNRPQPAKATREASPDGQPKQLQFSKAEIVLGIFCLYPNLWSLIDELLPPEADFASRLHSAIKQAHEAGQNDPQALELEPDEAERLSILLLFCEENNFMDWSESLAMRELRLNCQAANRDLLQKKQREIAKQMIRARAEGNAHEELELSAQYLRIVKLGKLAK